MLKMQESSFLGVEGATSLKAEITGPLANISFPNVCALSRLLEPSFIKGKIPELNSAAHYRSARKLVQAEMT